MTNYIGSLAAPSYGRAAVAFALAAQLALGGCSGQTASTVPDAGGVAPGSMQVTFRAARAFDLGTYGYGVVFNTSGNGVTP